MIADWKMVKFHKNHSKEVEGYWMIGRYKHENIQIWIKYLMFYFLYSLYVFLLLLINPLHLHFIPLCPSLPYSNPLSLLFPSVFLTPISTDFWVWDFYFPQRNDTSLIHPVYLWAVWGRQTPGGGFTSPRHPRWISIIRASLGVFPILLMTTHRFILLIRTYLPHRNDYHRPLLFFTSQTPTISLISYSSSP